MIINRRLRGSSKLCPVYHVDCDVLLGDTSVGDGKVAHVTDLPVVLGLPLHALLPQQPDLVVHVCHAAVELIVLQ